MQKAALGITDSRYSSKGLSVVAIAIYVVFLFVSFQSALAQDPMQLYAPHTLALRMLYHWLLSAVLVSSATGTFPSETTVSTMLEPVYEAITTAEVCSQHITDIEHGSYGHRPYEDLSKRSILPMIPSSMAVFVPCTCAFIMSWITPVPGLGCRNFEQLGFCGGWMIRFLLSFWRRRWAWLQYAFDFVFAVAMILIQFLAWKGWFNSCKCWGTFWTVPGGRGHVIPHDLAMQILELESTYFGIVIIPLSVEVLISMGMLVRYWPALKLMYGKSLRNDSTRLDGVDSSSRASTAVTSEERFPMHSDWTSGRASTSSIGTESSIYHSQEVRDSMIGIAM